MNISLLTVGKLKEKYFKLGIEEYAKRLGAYAKVRIIEVPDEKAPENLSEAEVTQVKQAEGERLLKKLPENAYAIALAIKGKQMPSEDFASKIQDLATYGHSDIAFIIGGSNGLSNDVLKRADFQLSFSQFTFPHQLMRLILIEQIYRAFKIMRGEPYHK
ncbi:23S rRNA (pseudouridine(1915)-N(3))-methyltransferase RlmH [Sporolactobacillus inulinus]|uniref:Ribosomal RNA large subunit methyltransferase H n=2 Tax=Sporolactobacillus inulinus TaxID=2078 RepID=A0A4Y1Z9I8_9BACL|nr:23S rRNA (pseudouridine(1915)-N(3))-methyltransferase RlmH [Sporolactobacillus inulinus]KLI01999.1 50S rRNA methyltransferase [Sporolactobacillus inulinus CASD]GAY75571.1 LSU m3Psi1915 methyltransferase RlmH [Sporolactobacillus inulinus]GEB78548.1 ribosomal RNA large subunit methyltransferase H [Sporolactobacillus inulinus]